MWRLVLLSVSFWLCMAPVDAQAEQTSASGVEWPNWLGPPLQSGTSMLMGSSLYVGYLMERGANEVSTAEKGYSTPQLNAVTYWERQGFTSGIITGAILAAAISARAYFVKDIEYEKRGDSWYKISTYYSDQERREIGEAGGELGANIATSGHSSAFELTVYSRSLLGDGDGSGYKLNFLFGSGIGKNFLLEYGFGFGAIRALGETLETGERVEFRSRYLGVPLRFSWAAPWFVLYSQWDLNVLSLFDASEDELESTAEIIDASRAPFRLGAQANLFGRVFLDICGLTPSLISGDFGWRLVAGVRF